jgi:hypothetical protein
MKPAGKASADDALAVDYDLNPAGSLSRADFAASKNSAVSEKML